MSTRSFVPWVEQLEGRLLMAVMTDVMPYLAAGSGLIEAAAIATHQIDNDLDVVVRSEDSAAGHMLVVELKNLDQPRTIGILGGDLARTAPDGTVRLRQPPNVRSLELTISDANDRQYSFLRVEFDDRGHVVRQTPIELEMLAAPDHNSFHGTTDQLSRLHTSTAHGRSSAGDYMAGPSSGAESHAMDARTYDEVLTHYGMASMPTMTPYNSIPNHAATMPVNSLAANDEFSDSDSPNEHGTDDSEASPIQLAMAMPETADEIELDEFSEVQIEDAEVVDAVLVSWQVELEFQPENQIPTSQLVSLGVEVDSPTEIESRKPDSRGIDSVFPSVAAVTEVSLTMPSVGLPNEASNSTLPAIGGCLLAVACAAGVFVLERKGDKTRDEEL